MVIYTDGCTYNHGTFLGINILLQDIKNARSSTASVCQHALNHLAIKALAFLRKILQKYCWCNLRNLAMVTLPHSDDVTTKDFKKKVWYFKKNKWRELLFYVFSKMK